MRWAVLLAGGSGSRFWPLSTPQHPEAAAPALGRRLDRGGSRRAPHRPDPARAHPGGRRRRRSPAGSARCSAFRPRTIWSSRARRRPRPRSSGPPGRRSGATPTPRCCRCTPTGPSATPPPFGGPPRPRSRPPRAHDRLVTVGVVPSRPETGYGYIVPGAPLDDGARTVARFSEKPDAATALDLMAAGALWNSGLFAWTADRLLAEVERAHPRGGRRPAPAPGAATSPDSSATVTPISIDVGLLERSGAVAVVTRGVRLGRRRHLAGARPGPAQGSERQRRSWARLPAGIARLHRLVRPRPDRAVRRAGPRGRAGQRPDPGHAHRAGGRDEAAARRPSARDPRHRRMIARRSTCSSPTRRAPRGPRSPASGRSPSSARARGASASGGRRPCDAEASAILGAHVDGFHEGDEPPVRRRGPIDGPGDRRPPRWFAPTGDPLVPATGRRAAAPASTAPPSAGSCAAGERWNGPHEEGDAVEIDGLPLRGSFDLVTALERFLAEDCADFRGAPTDRRARGQPRARRPGRRHRDGRGGRARRGVRRAPRGGRARARRRGAARHPARGPGLRRARTPSCSAASSAPRRSGPSAGCTARSRPACSSATPTRATTGSSGHSVVGHWVNLGALTTTSNLKNTYGPVRLELRRRADRDRTPEPGHPVRRPRQDGDRHHARHRHRGRRRRQPVRPADAAQVRAAVRVGQRGRRAAHRRRLPPRRRAGDDRGARCRADARAAPVARADVRAGHRADDAALRAGLGLARQLLRGRGGRRGDSARCGVQRPGDRAPGGDGGAGPGAGRGDRADARARRPRLRRAPAGAAARRAGAHGAGNLGPARAGACGGRATGRSASAQRSSWARSGSRPAPPATTPRTRWRSRSAAPTAPASAWPTTWAGRPPPCATCCGTSPRSCSRPTTTRCSSGPAATRRWCSAGSPGQAATCRNRAAAELLVELHHPGLAVVVLAHLSQRCNSADDARAAVAPALRRAGFRGDAARGRAGRAAGADRCGGAGAGAAAVGVVGGRKEGKGSGRLERVPHASP